MNQMQGSDRPPPTYITELTPPGRAAVAVILAAGPDATCLVNKCFQAANNRALVEQRLGRICFGRWQPGGEELIVCRRDPLRVEIHCHGGHAAVAEVVGALVSAGGNAITWQEYGKRQEPDRLAAAAREALAAAPTLRTAQILLDQYHGALRREILAITQEIQQDRRSTAIEQIERLLSRADCGLHLTQPWRVVLYGEPNVGKSSLINALLGYERAIVFDQPGTTRDVVSATTALDGWPVVLCDTAGLRETNDSLEQLGVARTGEMLNRADRRVCVVETSGAPAPGGPRPDLVVLNKVDLVADRSTESTVQSPIATSTVTGEGIDRLAAEIARCLVPDPPPTGAAVPFESGQVLALQELLASLQQGGEPDFTRLNQLV